MITTKLLAVLFITSLAGCANQEYAQYLETTSKIEAAKETSRTAEAVARYNADAAKYKAMSDIATTGDQTDKVAAVMAIALGEQKSNTSGVTHSDTKVQLPPTNQALQWASILVPSLTQMVGMNYNYRMAETQSNNARDIAVSTNQTFSGLGTNLKDTATSGFTSNQSVATSGFTALTTAHSDSMVGATAIAKMIQAPIPTTTTTTTTDNHTTNPTVVIPTKVCSVDATGVLTCL